MANKISSYDALLESGFEADAFFSADPDVPTFGLNLTLAWPLPAELKEAYENLRRELSALGEFVHVYPYERTHVTVMTLVNFKKHQHPEKSEMNELNNLVPKISDTVSEILKRELHGKVKPFRINVEPPVLARSAAYLPILNPTGEIFLLRNHIAPVLEKEFGFQVEYNKDFIHSTIMRFRGLPKNNQTFIDGFCLASKNRALGSAHIDEFCLTSETKPYMREGERLAVFKFDQN